MSKYEIVFPDLWSFSHKFSSDISPSHDVTALAKHLVSRFVCNAMVIVDASSITIFLQEITAKDLTSNHQLKMQLTFNQVQIHRGGKNLIE